MAKKYDVIVIGSGIAGMGAAALLAKNFGKKVLVAEKAPFIGGRSLSMVGKGDRMTVDGLELDVNGFRQMWEYNGTWPFAAKGFPAIEECFQKGLFDGYTMDSGHGLFWGNRSRVRCLLDYLDVPVDLPTNTGFAYIDYRGGNRFYQVGKGEAYGWMSPQEYGETIEQLRAMAMTEYASLKSLMKISLQEWLEQRKINPKTYAYIKNLAASQTVQNDLSMTPAGDFLGYQAMARDIKMNLVDGSVGTISNPGVTAIPLAMEECLNSFGGKVLRNTPVEQVIVEKGTARGVILRTRKGFETIYADRIICNLMPKAIFSIIHPRHFDQEFVSAVRTKFFTPSLLTGMIGLKRNVLEEKGIDERSFIYMPDVVGPEEGFRGGAVDVVMWNMSSSAGKSVARPSICRDHGRAPDGERDYCFSLPLLDYEMNNPDKVKRLTEFCENWFKRTFRSWKEDVKFFIWTACDRAYGNWRPVGMERPDVTSPHIGNLFFTGDQYGKRMWGGGVDGAGLCAVMTVDAMMGTRLEEQIFPVYHRGVPEDKVWE